MITKEILELWYEDFQKQDTRDIGGVDVLWDKWYEFSAGTPTETIEYWFEEQFSQFEPSPSVGPLPKKAEKWEEEKHKVCFEITGALNVLADDDDEARYMVMGDINEIETALELLLGTTISIDVFVE